MMKNVFDSVTEMLVSWVYVKKACSKITEITEFSDGLEITEITEITDFTQITYRIHICGTKEFFGGWTVCWAYAKTLFAMCSVFTVDATTQICR